MNCLDTSAIIELLYATEKGSKIQQLVSDKPLATSSFSVHELQIGLKPKEVDKIANLFKEMKIFEYDKQAALASAKIQRVLQKEGKLINQIDIFIAGIVAANNLHLITCDADFAKISDLNVTLC